MNIIVIIGNLVRDIETRYTKNGVPVSNGTIALNNSKRQANGEFENEASFFDFVMIGDRHEKIMPYLIKGKRIGITGELKQDRWITSEGKNRSTIKIIAHKFDFLSTYENQPSIQKEHIESNINKEPIYTNNNENDDDIPF